MGKAKRDGRQAALITGASAGIGAALAHEFAVHDFDVVLVARREDQLQALAGTLRRMHGVHAVVLPKDLLRRHAASEIQREVSHLRIDVLVNNAGVYEVGPFDRMALNRMHDMLQLNIATVVDLTRLFLPPMIERNAGHILNVASIAAFQAVPLLTLYAASKAFVLSLTEGLAEELKETDVRVTAVCPGITETEGVRKTQAKSEVAAAIPGLLISDEDDVAREAYAACMAGEVIRVPGALNKLMCSVNQYPRSFMRVLGGVVSRHLNRQ